MTPPYFDHEKLDVYRFSIAFCAWVGDFLPLITTKTSAKDQLDRASTSIPLNIAEGNGKFSVKDRAAFDADASPRLILVARKLATAEQVSDAKADLARIVRMMIGLLKRFSERADVLQEEDGHYGYQEDQEHDQDQEQEREQ